MNLRCPACPVRPFVWYVRVYAYVYVCLFACFLRTRSIAGAPLCVSASQSQASYRPTNPWKQAEKKTQCINRKPQQANCDGQLLINLNSNRDLVVFSSLRRKPQRKAETIQAAKRERQAEKRGSNDDKEKWGKRGTNKSEYVTRYTYCGWKRSSAQGGLISNGM